VSREGLDKRALKNIKMGVEIRRIRLSQEEGGKQKRLSKQATRAVLYASA
jgi:hypothetical protein